MHFLLSSRAAAIGASKKRKWEEDEEDMTKDLEDPPPETNITEVHNPKQGMFNLILKTKVQFYTMILELLSSFYRIFS